MYVMNITLENMDINMGERGQTGLGAQARAATTRAMSQIITALPLSAKMDALTYMEAAEQTPQSRNMQRMFDLLDGRCAETDAENT